ncbi:MAG: rRNA maturation RNase YbeY [Rubrobacteraceae bacterium]
MFHVPVSDDVGYKELDSAGATELCAITLTTLGYDLGRVGEISLALVDTKVIRDLNLKYRDKDSPTDVLSFGIDGIHGEMVGEIVISPADLHPDLGVEELVVHGMLHLAGFDHGDDFESTEMARVQRAVMDSVNDPEK